MNLQVALLVALVLPLFGGGCTRNSGSVSSDTDVGGNPTCIRTSDCGHDFVHLVDGKCCTGSCSPRALTLSQLSHLAEKCDRIGWGGEKCPIQKCEDPMPVACVDGRCVLIAP